VAPSRPNVRAKSPRSNRARALTQRPLRHANALDIAIATCFLGNAERLLSLTMPCDGSASSSLHVKTRLRGSEAQSGRIGKEFWPRESDLTESHNRTGLEPKAGNFNHADARHLRTSRQAREITERSENRTCAIRAGVTNPYTTIFSPSVLSRWPGGEDPTAVPYKDRAPTSCEGE
jgi:hypothetical protein